MKSRRRAIVFLLIFAGLSSAQFLTRQSRQEPTHEGSTLSEWLKDLDYGIAGFDPAASKRAEKAVVEIGTNALPWLVRMIRYKEPFWRKHYDVVMARQSVIKVRKPAPEKNIQWRGARGVAILGHSASNATPHLITLFSSPVSWVRCGAAMATGESCRDPALGVPPLIALLGDPVPDVRNCAAIALSKIGPPAHAALPALQKRFADPSIDTRRLVFSAYGSITNDPTTLLPVLLRQLEEPQVEARVCAAIILGALGTNGSAALPALRNLLAHDTDRGMQRAAAASIERISGMSLNKPGISFRFVQSSAEQLLKVLADLRGVKLDYSPGVRKWTPVTVESPGPMTEMEAAKLIEEELRLQAAIVVKSGSNGVLRVDQKH